MFLQSWYDDDDQFGASFVDLDLCSKSKRHENFKLCWCCFLTDLSIQGKCFSIIVVCISLVNLIVSQGNYDREVTV